MQLERSITTFLTCKNKEKLLAGVPAWPTTDILQKKMSFTVWEIEITVSQVGKALSLPS